jgi:hypothetical protein
MHEAAHIDEELMQSLSPVLSDIARTVAVPIEIRDEEWSSFPGQLTAMIYTQDGTGTGVSVMAYDELAQRVALAADQLQDIVVEALWTAERSTSWPECPIHPGTHPLNAELTAAGPMWRCARSGVDIVEIGSLRAAETGSA